MATFALHQITMMAGGPAQLVRFAADNGINSVCLFTATPADENGADMFPVVPPQAAASFRQLLRAHGMTVLNAEYFPIMAALDISDYLPAIALAAELGAKRLVTHIHDSDPTRAADQLAALCAIARDHGLEVGLEFTGFAAGCNSLENAVALHRLLQQPNLTIAIDALHLFRTGGTLAELQALDPAIIGYAQLCDGPDLRVTDDYLDEAMHRLIPGDGIFPLQQLVAILGPHVDIDIEVPGGAGLDGPTARARAARAIAASRALYTKGS